MAIVPQAMPVPRTHLSTTHVVPHATSVPNSASGHSRIRQIPYSRSVPDMRRTVRAVSTGLCIADTMARLGQYRTVHSACVGR
eukprot:2194592-Rhodomonas_salina.1